MNDIFVGAGKVIVIIVLGIGLCLLFTWPTMMLWNWVMPTFGLPTLGFWKTFGLACLMHLLMPKASK